MSVSPRNLYRIDKESNTAFIDVNINFYREIYNEWDFSPYINRDLDDDLFEYLEHCAEEIATKYNLCIVFHVPESIKNLEKEQHSIIGFKNYFSYQIRKLKTKQLKLIRRMFQHGAIGVVLIYSAQYLNNIITTDSIFRFLVEGIFIGSWVLFWELFSTLFFKQSDARVHKKLLHRLNSATLTYSYKKQTVADYKQHLSSLAKNEQ